MNGKRGRENMADINDFIKAFIGALNVIHAENMLIMATIADKDMDDPYIKNMDEMFNKAIAGVMKK